MGLPCKAFHRVREVTVDMFEIANTSEVAVKENTYINMENLDRPYDEKVISEKRE